MSDSAPRKPRRILGVGVAALDIINEVAHYPAEDEELRALARYRRRGGNTANTLDLLSQLGHACTWVGTLGDDEPSEEILRDLGSRGIDTRGAVRHAGRGAPTSYVILSRASASRTILHFRDLAELAAEDFERIPLDGYDWVHFEGRNPAQTSAMLRSCAARRPGLPLSLELEKPRDGAHALLHGPDVLLYSRAYAHAAGYQDPRRFLSDQWSHTSARALVLFWGETGAYGQERAGELHFAPAEAGVPVVDTLGAGDVANAGLIDGLLAGLGLPAALERANRLAGHKCGRRGLDGTARSALAAGLI